MHGHLSVTSSELEVGNHLFLQVLTIPKTPKDRKPIPRKVPSSPRPYDWSAAAKVGF
jgi:hypothetical protein